MKKLCLLAMMLAFFGLSACTQEESLDSAYLLYFPVAEGEFSSAAIDSEVIELAEEAELISSLLGLLIAGPTEENLVDIFPTGVRVRDWTLEDGVLYVDFTSRYGLLSGIDLTLADYSVTMTLTQLEEVSAVVTTVEGDRATYRENQKMQNSDVAEILETKESPSQ